MINSVTKKYRIQGWICILLSVGFFCATYWWNSAERSAHSERLITGQLANSELLCRTLGSRATWPRFVPCDSFGRLRKFLWLRLASHEEFLIEGFSVDRLKAFQVRLMEHPNTIIGIRLDVSAYRWHKKKDSIIDFQHSGRDEIYQLELIHPGGQPEILGPQGLMLKKNASMGITLIFAALGMFLLGVHYFRKARSM